MCFPSACVCVFSSVSLIYICFVYHEHEPPLKTHLHIFLLNPLKHNCAIIFIVFNHVAQYFWRDVNLFYEQRKIPGPHMYLKKKKNSMSSSEVGKAW